MKANVVLKAVIMAVLVMASVMNFSASAATPISYVRNDEMSGELVTSRTIFKNEGGYLFRHLLYTFTYDNENRVVNKEAFRWDNAKEAWVPYFNMNVEYKDQEVVVNYGRWNARSHAYDSHLEKSVYQWNAAQGVLLASVK